MGYVLKAVLSSAQHPEYGQITVPFPIPDEKYDRMIELLEPLEIGDALRQDCRVDELDSFYTVLNRLVGSLVNFDELDYLAKRLDSFDDGEAAQFQGMACKLGVSNIKDFINLTFCCQQATVITDFSDLDAIGRQHYMTMQGGGCRIEELERLDGRKFALDLILNHLEGRITPYGVVYDTRQKVLSTSERITTLTAELNDGNSKIEEMKAEFNRIVSWSKIFDESPMEVKKMICGYIIKKVSVFRDYRVKIEFNINVEQFLNGIDSIDECATYELPMAQ